VRLTRTTKRAAAVTLAAAALGLGAATSAHAAPTDLVMVNGSCEARVQVQPVNGTNAISVDPVITNSTCQFGILNLYTGAWIWGPTSSATPSPWIPDPNTTLVAGIYSSSTGKWAYGG
jgi:hypothetical protein